jgi:hypothetical protein
LIERLMDAYLLNSDYPRAADFGSACIEKNPANQEALGGKLRNEVDRLRDTRRTDDALKLIDAINSMRVKLPSRVLDRIRVVEQELRSSPAAPRSAVGNVQDAVGSGQ